jgi:hypothetical protein
MNNKPRVDRESHITVSRKWIVRALAVASIAGGSVLMAQWPVQQFTVGGTATLSPPPSTSVTYDLDYTGAAVTRTWDSGKTTHLSGFSWALCPANYGGERLIVKFVGHRERSGNADNFIARLSAVCRRYGPDQAWVPYGVADHPPDDDTKLLYSREYKSGAMATEVEVGGNGDNVPVGVRLRVNRNEYVKDIELLYRISTTSGLGSTLQDTGYMTGLSGDVEELQCPANYAMTGVRVKHSTDSGKLRVFQIECHRLVH